jgi:hypothetical protein
MILSVDDLLVLPEFEDQDRDFLDKKLQGIEILIRKYTNNNFQNRNIRFLAPSNGQILNGISPFLRVDDTIQITGSEVNDGLYIVQDLDLEAGTVTVDRDLFPVQFNLVTKVEYPVDVQMGVINLMKWEIQNRDKVGIKSESLSRHSVTYFDQDSNNQVMGYPVSLMGFLEHYKKARF